MTLILSYVNCPPYMSELCYLKNLTFFDGSTEEEIDKICKIAVTRNYPKGSLIYFGCEERGKVYILREGVVSLYEGENGRKIIIDSLKRGEIFGDLDFSFGEGNENCFFAQCRSDTRVDIIDKKEFMSIISENPRVLWQMIGILGQKIREQESRIKDLAIGNAESRIINELRRLGKIKRKGCYVADKITHQSLGERVGLSRESVTKTLGKLKKMGVVELLEDRRYRIC